MVGPAGARCRSVLRGPQGAARILGGWSNTLDTDLFVSQSSRAAFFSQDFGLSPSRAKGRILRPFGGQSTFSGRAPLRPVPRGSFGIKDPDPAGRIGLVKSSPSALQEAILFFCCQPQRRAWFIKGADRFPSLDFILYGPPGATK